MILRKSKNQENGFFLADISKFLSPLDFHYCITQKRQYNLVHIMDLSGKQICSRCGTPVSVEDLASGNAIQILGRVICCNCIKSVSSLLEEKKLPKQVYRYPSRRHRKLTRYTFLTSAHLVPHRKAIKEGKEFNVPDLPKDFELKTKNSSSLFIVAASFFFVLILVTLALVFLPKEKPQEKTSTTKKSASIKEIKKDVPVVKVKVTPKTTVKPTVNIKKITRANFSTNSQEAYFEISQKLNKDPELFKEIRKEFEEELNSKISIIKEELSQLKTKDDNSLLDLSSKLAKIMIPDNFTLVTKNLTDAKNEINAFLLKNSNDRKLAEEKERKRLEDLEKAKKEADRKVKEELAKKKQEEILALKNAAKTNPTPKKTKTDDIAKKDIMKDENWDKTINPDKKTTLTKHVPKTKSSKKVYKHYKTISSPSSIYSKKNNSLLPGFHANIGKMIFTAKSKKIVINLDAKDSEDSEIIDAEYGGINILINPNFASDINFIFIDTKGMQIQHRPTKPIKEKENKWQQVLFDFTKTNNEKFNYKEIAKIVIKSKNTKPFAASRIISYYHQPPTVETNIRYRTLENINTEKINKYYPIKKSIVKSILVFYNAQRQSKTISKLPSIKPLIPRYGNKQFSFSKSLSITVPENKNRTTIPALLNTLKPQIAFIFASADGTKNQSEKEIQAIWNRLIAEIIAPSKKTKRKTIPVIVFIPSKLKKALDNEKEDKRFFDISYNHFKKRDAIPIINLRHIKITKKGSFQKGEAKRFTEEFGYAFEEIMERVNSKK